MPARRSLLPLLAALGAALATAAAAGAPAGGAQPLAETDTNPCHDPVLALRCPDLTMAPPSDLRVRRVGRVLRLLATNHIVNVGAGPLEVRAHRRPDSHAGFVAAYQVIQRAGGRAPVFFPEAGWTTFKAVPGKGSYWKYYGAARFELWSLNADGTRARLRRTGPKLTYCFRDLDRVLGGRAHPRTPRRRVYPACSQDARRSVLRLGVSPGWADAYPSTYPQNWISITGLRGCFAFVHRADPRGELIEQREDNNIAQRLVRLPPRHGSIAPRGCPRAR